MTDYAKDLLGSGPTSSAPTKDYASELIAPQPLAQTKAPEAKKPTRLQRAVEIAGKSGFNPMIFGVNMAGEGMNQLGQLVDKAAYGAGGKVTDVLAPHVPPEVAAGAGFATNVAVQAVPTVLGGEAAKVLGSPALKAAGQGVMKSALKPPPVTQVGGAKSEAAKAITTMLDEGVNVTPGGAAKLRGMIDKLNKEVVEKIATSPATVDKGVVYKEYYKTLQRFRNQVTPGADLKAIREVWKEFDQLIPSQIPVQQAQALKQGTQQILSGKYGELGSAGTEAQKGVARGLRVGIEQKVPEVAQLNAKEKALIEALELTEHRAATSGNANVGGLAWLANNPKAAAAFAADRSSLFKSILARMLYQGQRNIPGAVGSGAVGAYEVSTQNQE